ncbi:BTAD domain-containing putative transcriptional regulator [Saccharothrix longispora]|uniref:DNA-binding SARP family transcriptional activator n=1 Tax=Saccharothrix longispora TaxID=33920 RepID=A0ABU1Q1N7_9PSEU|nr:BTAD domain-containing putative transcriptional regulator [Saccharothrix longispora]MDR6596812.1 DNA-binding SARP family transcriptional activator [Saccharothrix longispora]
MAAHRNPRRPEIRFAVLGPLEVRHGDREVAVPGGRARALLAALLLRADRTVPVEDLVARLWNGDAPAPRRAKATLQMVVTRLRQALGEANVVRTTANGYAAEVPPGALDLHVFRELAAGGEYAAALRLWRGTPVADVASPVLRREDVPPLLEEHLVVLERRIEADLEAGGGDELEEELRGLVARYPLRERFCALLMTALARSGRRTEALAAYAALRARLVDRLGVEPGPNLQRLHRELPAPRPVAPRRLPPRTGFFVGRRAELAALDGLLDVDAGTAVVAAIGGTAGVGKTALAVHWAHEVADRFPDGRLYADLRGYDPTADPVRPDEAIRHFLDALGVDRDRVPVGLDARAALYRTVLADRRVLVLLDNARDSEQVRPLLPGGTAPLVLITSRNDLSGLVVREGAVPLSLDLLDEPEARALLERRIGSVGRAAEPAALDSLVAHCAGLPLALAIVAARAAADPDLPLGALAAELADERTRLAALDAGDPATAARAVFSWSCRRLSESTARVFRLLGLHPGPHVTPAATASLAGVGTPAAKEALRELVRSRLMSQPAPGRYAFHDLTRLYAADEAREHHDEGERRAAVRGLLDHLLHSADRADRLLHPQRDPVALVPADPGAVPVEPADHRAALAWFATEHPVLVGAVELAHEEGFDAHAWQLAWTVATYFQRQGHWRDQLATQQVALAAGLRLGDLDAQVRAHRNIGLTGIKTGDLDGAARHYGLALELSSRLGDDFGRARAHRGLAAVHERRGRYEDSLRECASALELFRGSGRRAAVAGALNAVGWFHSLLGDHDAALAHCREALSAFRELGDLFGQAGALDSLGHALHHSGRHDEAVARFREAVELWRDTGAKDEEARTSRRLGHAERDRGDVPAALAALERAAELFDGLDPAEAAAVREEVDRLSPARHGR